MTSSLVTGVEAMHVNVAGMSRINKTEVLIGNSIYLQGTGINTNAFGITQRVGKEGAFGFSLMALDFRRYPCNDYRTARGVLVLIIRPAFSTWHSAIAIRLKTIFQSGYYSALFLNRSPTYRLSASALTQACDA